MHIENSYNQLDSIFEFFVDDDASKLQNISKYKNDIKNKI